MAKLTVNAEIHIPQPVIIEEGRIWNEGNFYILEVELSIDYSNTTKGIRVNNTFVTGYMQESLERLMAAIPELKEGK